MGKILPDGPRTAQLALITGQPGADGARIGKPLTGFETRELNQLFVQCGINRTSLYTTSVLKDTDGLSKPTEQEIRHSQVALYRELSELSNLNCIIPLMTTHGAGPYARMDELPLQVMSNFTSKGTVHERGSILKSFIGIKMVPTYGPSYYMQGKWEIRAIVQCDLARALAESYHPHYLLPVRTFYIEPSYREALEWLHFLSRGKRLSFDIETMPSKQSIISCIAFSTKPDEAFCIPFFKNGGRTPYWNTEEWPPILREIQKLFLRSDVCYIAQNGLFDCWHLWRHGVETPYMKTGFDTMYAHRLLAADLPHSLEFLASIYTREPYYKDESGSWKDSSVPDQQFWIYNCKDAATTVEIATVLQKELDSIDQLSLYQDEIQMQWDVVMDMQQRGIRVDPSQLAELRRQILEELMGMETELERLVGWKPNTRSTIEMARLFEQCGIRGTPTEKGNLRKDEEHLLQYAAAYPLARDILMLIININKRRTIRDGFLNLSCDSQGYYHPHYDISHAVTGRMSSKKSDSGGPQLQNIPMSVRRIFIPDPGQVFTGGDLKQAEAMFVAWDAQDPLLMASFSGDKDVHRVRACIIFHDWRSSSLPPDDLLASVKETCPACQEKGILKCNHSERYIAKQSGHAFTYKMGIRKFIRLRREEGLFISESKAREIQECCISQQIAAWQKQVERELRQSPWLETPLGRKREFYGVLDEDMIRAALSWKAQATVSQITNMAIIKLYDLFQTYPDPKPRVVTQTHDSALVSHHPAHTDLVHADMIKAFTCPINIHNNILNIPLELSTGPSWGELK